MKLKEFPPLIFEASQKLAEIDREISLLKTNMARGEAIADDRVAFDASLKNDLQRAARKRNILPADYHDHELDLIAMKHERTVAAAELQGIENEFKVAILEVRLKIAQTKSDEI